MKPPIKQQKEILSIIAMQILKTGYDFDIVNEHLKEVIIQNQFDKDINVDAIRYLSKCKLGLL